MRRRIILALLSLSCGTAALAQDAPITSAPPAKIRSITLTPGATCPESTNGEIVVCQTIDEPYRIPKELRTLAPSASNRAWASRVAGLDDASRDASGLPDSCSTTGTGGQTGCTQQLIQRWSAERREAQQDRREPR
ncbi:MULTISPECIES: hypothetical protein [unclassified Sphingomonas]|uniref:hypothetical protein n=1 Tax=unclassified Sphingomonas TaxID=196159 RepID=UPI000BC83C89|nr:MAG: hypothetical protein B7Z43_05135 [Sphingomonas sp. 12-62-6]OYX37097.1 MAG: hypothetical protein B7Y98_13665 [Sphingomonas sp. 32-62-10]